MKTSKFSVAFLVTFFYCVASAQNATSPFSFNKESYVGDVTNSRGVLKGVRYQFKDFEKGKGRVFGSSSGMSDSGTWRTEDGKLCMSLRDWMAGEKCFEVRYVGDKLTIGDWFKEN